ncbi:MAG: nucleotidyltransferase family protein [Gammaproteobacteria bacterium]
MKAMILAAGYGKRMMPLTENLPKPLLKIGNESLIERNINALLAAGFNDIIINISYLGSMIKKHVLEIFPNANISFSEEEIPLGTGGGVLNAIGLLGKDPFLLINADIYHQINLKDLEQDVDIAHLVGVENPDHNADGDFSLNSNVVSIKNNLNECTWSGISIINPKIFDGLKIEDAPFDIWKSILIEYVQKNKVTGELSNSTWIDTGTIDRLELANKTYKDEN